MIPEILDYDNEAKACELIEKTSIYLEETGISKLVIGASTGLDSTTSSYLAKEVVSGDNLILLHLPHDNHKETTDEFNRICEMLEVPENNRITVDILPMLDAYPNQGSVLQMTNLLTRIQRAIMFDYSHKNHALLYGTLNRTEHELGEYPIFALEASIQPIRSLFKTQVKHLGEFLGVPNDILERIPRIDSWKGKSYEINRTELVRIGIPNVDQILKHHIDFNESAQEIAEKGFEKTDVDFVINLQRKNQFKKDIPYVL